MILASLVMMLAAKTVPAKTVLYAAVGAELTEYDLDPASATLTRRTSVTLPANVQEAWQHPSRKYLYVAWSSGGASYTSIGGATPKNDRHGITAFRIDSTTGALLPLGNPVSLPSRPVFITTDIDGTHVITAHNDPSALVVHRVMPDGTLGAEVKPATPLDFGIFGQQVRVDPSNKTVILITRGNGPTATKPEDPGALKIFSYKDGVLANQLSIAPNKGFGYQVRHLDFHPSGKWAFVTLERQNRIHVYRRMPDGTLDLHPLFVKDTLEKPANSAAVQSAASIHVHPTGKFVYVGKSRERRKGDRRKQHRGLLRQPADRRAHADPVHRHTRLRTAHFLAGFVGNSARSGKPVANGHGSGEPHTFPYRCRRQAFRIRAKVRYRNGPRQESVLGEDYCVAVKPSAARF